MHTWSSFNSPLTEPNTSNMTLVVLSVAAMAVMSSVRLGRERKRTNIEMIQLIIAKRQKKNWSKNCRHKTEPQNSSALNHKLFLFCQNPSSHICPFAYRDQQTGMAYFSVFCFFHNKNDYFQQPISIKRRQSVSHVCVCVMRWKCVLILFWLSFASDTFNNKKTEIINGEKSKIKSKSTLTLTAMFMNLKSNKPKCGTVNGQWRCETTKLQLMTNQHWTICSDFTHTKMYRWWWRRCEKRKMEKERNRNCLC